MTGRREQNLQVWKKQREGEKRISSELKNMVKISGVGAHYL